jgi:hypothetical protein
MSSIVQTSAPIPASRVGQRKVSVLWMALVAVLAAIIGCAVLASTYADPAASAVSLVGP